VYPPFSLDDLSFHARELTLETPLPPLQFRQLRFSS
jgi:hypothetical protein